MSYIQSNRPFQESAKIGTTFGGRKKIFSRFTKKIFFVMVVSIVPVVYDKNDPNTDFSELIKRESHKDVLFIFNDNFQDRNMKMQGGNSARIRPYTFCSPPRAIGIPTGWSSAEGGFKTLSDDVKRAIFLSFERLNTILQAHDHIKRVFYSCDVNDHSSFGFAIFKPHPDVISYLKARIAKIPVRFDSIAVAIRALDIAEDKIEKTSVEYKKAIEINTSFFQPRINGTSSSSFQRPVSSFGNVSKTIKKTHSSSSRPSSSNPVSGGSTPGLSAKNQTAISRFFVGPSSKSSKSMYRSL